MNRILIATVLSSIYFLPLSAEPQSRIVGQVTDSSGAIIVGARVLVHWDSSGSTVGRSDNIGTKQDVIVVTDRFGNYSASVPAGFYDVFVSAMSFTPSASKVRVKKAKTSECNAKLPVDTLVMKELAHEAYPPAVPEIEIQH